MRELTQGLLVACAAYIAGVGPQYKLPRYEQPTAIQGRVPFATDAEFGEARFRLSSQQGIKVEVGLVDAVPSSFGTASLMRDIGTWIPNGHINGETIAIRFAMRPDGHCDRDINRHVDVQWPTLTILGSDFMMRCVSEGGLISDFKTVSPVIGLVVDESDSPLQDVDIYIERSDSGFRKRHVKTDSKGGFRFGNLPAGKYFVSFDGTGGLIRKEFFLTIGQEAHPDPWRVLLPHETWATKEPPAVVRAADFPQYPEDAWSQNVEGSVELRVSFAESARNKAIHEVADIDVASEDDRLGRAAKANLATWRFDDVVVPVLNVRYTFRLIPGDCAGSQIPKIVMRFPSDVEVVAKRHIVCRPSGY